jgi:hypothetical protein
MAAEHLSKRDNWQRGANLIGKAGENAWALAHALYMPDHYEWRKAHKVVIYPDGRGIVPDLILTNTLTGMSVYWEIKSGNNGGNAHERAYKYLSQPACEDIRKASPNLNLIDDPIMFGFVGRTFSGDAFITEGKNPSKVYPSRYQEELSLFLRGRNWFTLNEDHSWAEKNATQIMEIV